MQSISEAIFPATLTPLFLAIASKPGCSADSLRVWYKQAECDFEEGGYIFCAGGVRPRVSQMLNFIEAHRVDFRVEPMCNVLPIAPSTYYRRIAILHDPGPGSDRGKKDKQNCDDYRRYLEKEPFCLWDVFARKIVGWRVSKSMTTEFVAPLSP